MLAQVLTALITRRQHARMPLFVLGMSIAEPSPALPAVNGCWIIARLIVGRDCLAQALHFFFHRRLGLYCSRRRLAVVPYGKVPILSHYVTEILFDRALRTV